MRPEQIIFDDLASLCASPGFIHAIAFLCFRDNMIRYSGEMKAEDMQHLFSHDRLIRTETSTLIGLMIKNDIDYRFPGLKIVEKYIQSAETLLSEIHHGMLPSLLAGIDPEKITDKDFSPFTSGAALREPIFYSGESAYSFQYRDLSPEKYAGDEQWITSNKGFSLKEARALVHAISRINDAKSTSILKSMREFETAPDDWTFLPNFTFSSREVSEYANIDITTVEKFLSAFSTTSSQKNEQFKSLHDFNIANASPLICTPDGDYLLFNIYSLSEALYESPFYWMTTNKDYVNTALNNRGIFTEQFAVKCLTKVFGSNNVLSNIEILESKGKTLSEIDVLVLFGNRAIVLQAKSKRLTLEARRGNDNQIKDDFKKSVQDSSDQAYLCAQLLHEKSKYLFRDSAGNTVTVPDNLKKIYVICLVSDHYPALSFQARQFLKFTATETVSPPFVMDVFALDTMTEMLSSPLHLLSYIDRRTSYTEKLMASNELTILSYHLKKNLWLDEEYDMVMLEDDISADLDLAMLVRRGEVNGKKTPDGILTRLPKTSLGKIVEEIESNPNPATIDLGFMLLTLSEDAVASLSSGIDKIAKQSTADMKNHDMTVGFGGGSSGLTIHCSPDPDEIAVRSLEQYCHKRKYKEHV